MTNTEDQEMLSRRTVLATAAVGLAAGIGVSTSAAQESSAQESSAKSVVSQSSGYGTGGYGEGPYGGGTCTNPFPNGVPGVGNQPPTNVDGDCQLEDVNGDGTADFDDAISLAFLNPTGLNQAQIDALDFDRDGDLDFDDAITLAFQT